MSKQSYAEKLKDPKWQRKRLEILQRDEFTCQLCFGQETELHVHHGYYERGLDPWDYDAKTLITLCKDCHDYVGNRLRDIHLQIARLPLIMHDTLMGALLSVPDQFYAEIEKLAEKRKASK